MRAACASDDVLLGMARSALAADEAEPLRHHLDECTDCSTALLALVRGSRPVGAPPASLLLSMTGTRVGRFLLERELGSGNMGTVFLAEDPELDRTVAIKILRAGRDDAHNAARLVREAKAMARVRHPNVVTVYEVGQDRDVIFVAMEQVRGPTLRTLLRGDTPLAVRLDWVVQLAGALAAIHAAGLIHRDVKPDNVFLEPLAEPVGARTHRLVVGDFGLAGSGPLGHGGETATRREIAIGTLGAGTPAYMAPEQVEGDPLDARTDVFAFGITAWETLTGSRPIGERTAAALATALRRSSRRVPRAVCEVIARCVEEVPARRPASMAEVRLVLARRSPLPRVGALAAIVAVAVGGFATAQLATSSSADARCDRSPARWLGTRTAWLERARVLTPFTRDAIAAELDRRAVAWAAAGEAACKEDTIASEAWLRCRPKLEAIEASVLDIAVEHAWPDDARLVQRVRDLPAPDTCGDGEASEAAIAIARLPGELRRAEFTSGLAWIARAETYDLLGDEAARDRALASASRLAAAVAPSPLDGELGLARAVLTPPKEPRALVLALHEAAAAAERTGGASLIARSWLALAQRQGDLATQAEARLVDNGMQQADWAITRLGDPRELRSHWFSVAGSVAWLAGDRATARARFTAAAETAGSSLRGTRLTALALAKVATLSGDDRRAVEQYRALLADPQFLALLDAENRVIIESTLGEALYRLDDLDGAQRAFEAAIERARAELAPSHPQQVICSTQLATLLVERGARPRALELLERAQAAAHAGFGPEHPLYGATRARLAHVLLWDDPTNATGIAAAREAVRIFDARFGRRNEESIASRGVLAQAELATGDVDAAVAAYPELVADAAAVYGADHAMALQHADGYAQALASAGRHAEALAVVEAALPALERAGDGSMVAQCKYRIAVLVWPRDRARARRLVSEALAALPDEPGWAAERSQFARWLAEHPAR